MCSGGSSHVESSLQTFLTVSPGSLQLARCRRPRPGPLPAPLGSPVPRVVGFPTSSAPVSSGSSSMPIVNCYEIGTALAYDHALAATMGVYGMLASARRCSPCANSHPGRESGRRNRAKVVCLSLNIGLGLDAVFATLLPLSSASCSSTTRWARAATRRASWRSSPRPGTALLEWGRGRVTSSSSSAGCCPSLWMTLGLHLLSARSWTRCRRMAPSSSNRACWAE